MLLTAKKHPKPPVLSDLATLGGRLRAAMRTRGVTNDWLAERAGVHSTTVSKWRSDAQAPESNQVESIAAALDVEPAWLQFGGVDRIRSPGLVAEPRPQYDLEPGWPRGAHAIAARLEVAILESGGTPEAASWARRALLNPDSYVRFYPADAAGGEQRDGEVLAQLMFIGEGLFFAATGKLMPEELKHGGSLRKGRRT